MGGFVCALVDVPYDREYKNSIRFNNRMEQEQYFNVSGIFNNGVNVNFNIGSLINTTIVYNFSDVSLAVNANKNYCIVRDNYQYNLTEKTGIVYYYYFVTEVNHLVGMQYTLSLELDVMQTYYIDCIFNDSLINRAHLDRFGGLLPDGETIGFNSEDTSPLFYRENIGNLAKYTTARHPIKPYIDNGGWQEPINSYLDSGLHCWVYAYMKIKTGGYKYYINENQYSITSTPTLLDGDGRAVYKYPYYIVCAPITFAGRTIQYRRSISSTLYNNLTANGLFNFIEANGGEENVLSIKLSAQPPFKYGEYTTDDEPVSYKVVNDILQLTTRNEKFGGCICCNATSDRIKEGLLIIEETVESIENIIYGVNREAGAVTLPQIYFSVYDIINGREDVEKNPKLLSSDFCELKLIYGTSEYSYDIQKLGESSVELLYTEAYTPDITRTYIRPKIPHNYFPYNSFTQNNYTGLVSTVDLMLPYSVNQLETFLANNKNFYMQKSLSYAGNILSGALNKNFSELIRTPFKVADDILAAKNMQAAPEALKSSDGNALFTLGISSGVPHVEITRALDSEINAAHEYMLMYGYVYNRLDNIKNCDNIRKRYNYVQAEVDNVTTSYGLAEIVHNKIRRIFSNGIRLWNYDTIANMYDYKTSNYERRLE